MPSAELITSPHESVIPAIVPRPHSAQLDSILLYGSFSLLLFGPLAFGAVEPWAIFVISLGVSGLLLLWTWRQVNQGRLQIVPNPLYPPMLAFAALVGVQLVFRTSVYTYDTESNALQYCNYAVLALVASQTLQRTAQVRRLALIISSYGVAVALFALLQSLTSNGKLYWLRTPESGGWIYGPYVSHNHYAGLMEMLYPVALVAALSRSVRGAWKKLAAFAAIWMAGTIFLSGSRGGMLALLAQLVLLGTLLCVERTRRTGWIAVSVLILTAALILWAGGQDAISRVASIRSETRSELDSGTRFTIARDSIHMIGKKPILGWGIGTFPVVYPQFRSFYTNKFVNRAHNDYLQLLVESGFAGFVIAIWFIVALFRSGLSKLHQWQWDVNGSVALAALMGCTGILVHGLVDSNLQIPANAAWFYVLASIAAAKTQFGSHRRVRKTTSSFSVAGPE